MVAFMLRIARPWVWAGVLLLLLAGAACSGDASPYEVGPGESPGESPSQAPAVQPQAATTPFVSGVTPAAQNATALPAQAAGAVQTTAPSAAGIDLCPKEGTLTLLALAENWSAAAGQPGADALRLVKVDFARKTATLLALPPDLWLAGADGGGATLGQIYHSAKDGAQGSQRAKMQAAMSQLAQSMAAGFGYQVEYTLVVNQQTFSDLVDGLGGINVNLEQAIEGGGHSFPAGKQKLDGAAASELLRIYSDPGQAGIQEWSTFKYQRKVLRGLRQASLVPANLPRLPGMALQAYQDVASDLSIGQMFNLVCLATQPGLQVNFVGIGPELIDRQEEQAIYPKVDMLKGFLQLQVGK
jgi:hypothetical protein